MCVHLIVLVPEVAIAAAEYHSQPQVCECGGVGRGWK